MIKLVFGKLDSHYLEFFSCILYPHIHNLDLQNHFQLPFNSRSSRRPPFSRILHKNHISYFLLMVCISFMLTSSKLQTPVYFLPRSADTLSEERFLDLPYLTVSTHMIGMKVIYFVWYTQWLKNVRGSAPFLCWSYWDSNPQLKFLKDESLFPLATLEKVLKS